MENQKIAKILNLDPSVNWTDEALMFELAKLRQGLTHRDVAHVMSNISDAQTAAFAVMNRARDFLQKRDKVKFTVRFRGREIQHKELGEQLLLG